MFLVEVAVETIGQDLPTIVDRNASCQRDIRLQRVNEVS